jgi:hypothetical protein
MRPVYTASLLNQKEQASSANTPILHSPKKAKTIFSAGKIMTAVFWDSKGIIHWTVSLVKKPSMHSTIQLS